MLFSGTFRFLYGTPCIPPFWAVIIEWCICPSITSVILLLVLEICRCWAGHHEIFCSASRSNCSTFAHSQPLASRISSNLRAGVWSSAHTGTAPKGTCAPHGLLLSGFVAVLLSHRSDDWVRKWWWIHKPRWSKWIRVAVGLLCCCFGLVTWPRLSCTVHLKVFMRE